MLDVCSAINLDNSGISCIVVMILLVIGEKVMEWVWMEMVMVRVHIKHN